MDVKTIVNVINHRYDIFEEVKRIVLEVVSEINENSRYQLLLIAEPPIIKIDIEGLDRHIEIQPIPIKAFAESHNVSLKEQILRTIMAKLN